MAPKTDRPEAQKNSKKDKIKHNIDELDKMKRELEDKKRVKTETVPCRLTANNTGFKRVKEAAGTAQARTAYMPKAQTYKPVRNAKNAQLNAKTVEVKPALHEKVKSPKMEQEEEPMIARRMLVEKEKATLIARLMTLRQVIEKNQVCSDSLPEITDHLGSIEKLLTR